MDRLEQIVRAEERALNAVASAKEQARSILSEAKAESELIVSEAQAQARAEAELLRESKLIDSEREVGELAQHAATKMRDEIAIAESRIPKAVEAVVEELTR